MKFFLVGGAVRDTLLRLVVNDRDWVVVNGNHEKMIALGFKPVGKSFPVYLHPKTKEEYALARIEKKIGTGYRGFVCDASEHVTIEEDLKRRDLTINSIAMNENGDLIDPFNGIADIKEKIIRHTSKAFIEDPLRVFRTARFAAKYFSVGFSIAPETLELMQLICNSGELNALSNDRIWQETSKAIQTNSPEIFFKVLYKTNGLSRIFSERIQFDQSLLEQIEKSCKKTECLDIRITLIMLAFEEKNSGNYTFFISKIKIPNKLKSIISLTIGNYQRIQNLKLEDSKCILKALESIHAFRNNNMFFTIVKIYNFYNNHTKNTLTLLKKCQSEILNKKNNILQSDQLTGPEKKVLVEKFRIKIIREIIKKQGN